jgi:hypothetical protein
MIDTRRPFAVAIATAAAIFLLAVDHPLTQSQRGRRNLPTVLVDGREAVDGEVIVKYRTQTGSFERQRAEFDVESDEVEMLSRRGLRRMRSRRLGTRAMLQALRNNPDVEFAEPNYAIRLGLTPSEPTYNAGDLWGLLNFGQLGGTAGADIDASLAWDYTTGTRSVVVGVVDTGVDYNHPDLAANVWSAPAAFSVTIGSQTITCPAGSHGFNAINNTCNPMDDNNHGTHVSGTIGAVDNGFGIVGVNFRTSIMGLKFLPAAGPGFTSDAIKAIEFAIQAKAAFAGSGGANVRILSNSWGGSGFSQALLDEINRAANEDMLFVASAGNSAQNADVVPSYPAAYTAANILSVAATDRRDQLASFSNYGATSVDLGAPGVSIYSTVRNNGYSYFNGTSMAAPHVSGVAALVLAQCPNLNTADLRSIILTSTDPVASLASITATGGRLNAAEALNRCTSGLPALSASASGRTITANVSNGTGNRRDWLAVYCPSTSPDSSYIEYRFLNGLTTPPATGVTAATVSFSLPLNIAAGSSCDVRLFYNNSMSRLSRSGAVVISTTPVSITTSTPTVNPGGVISVTITGSTYPSDWAGLMPAAGPDSNYLQWWYLNGLKTMPAAPVANATVQFTAPSTPGTYNVRLFQNNGYSRLATSPTVTVAAQPTLTIADRTVVEGDAGSASVLFTVTLSPVNSTQTVTATFATANGTATTANNDYVATTGTVTFAPSVSTQTIAVTVNGDTVNEPNELFTVNLSNAANAGIGDSQAVGTITNDDAPPGVSVAVQTPSVSPGGTIDFTVANGPGHPADWVGLIPVASGDSAYQRWSYLNGLKTVPASGITNATLQFVAPATPGSYNIRLFAKDGLTKLATSGTIVVQSQPTLTINDVTVSEGNTGSINATFTVTLAPVNPSQTVTVDYATADGTATANSDYTPASGTLTFSPSVATQTVTVPVIGDTAVEGNEIFRVNLSNVANAVIGDAQGVATIVDNDVPPGPAVTLQSASVTVGGTVSFVVSGGPANRTDWIGFFPSAGGDSNYQQWSYLNGLKTAPAAGVGSATLQFVAPATPGTYNIRLFASDGFTKLATSATLTVTP